MEESNLGSTSNYESKKLLYKYQFAFLLMQRSFSAIGKIITTWETRQKFKSIAVWKMHCLDAPKIEQIQLQNILAAMQGKLLTLNSVLTSRMKQNMHTHLLKILKFAKLKQVLDKAKQEQDIIQAGHQQELEAMNQELANLQEKQKELENLVRDFKNKENQYKEQINGLKAGKAQNAAVVERSRKIAQEKEEEIVERIEDLREENAQLTEKLSAVENNVTGFIQEMGGLLEASEEPRKRSSISTSQKAKKTGKTGKRSKGPTITLDLGK